ncbi:hypothetical protein [Cytophaga hutchinsonii]|jgi:hypothetical protein|uniref:Carboxypeptidase regulatory-like domain-containing protein n=1 Tax=Cytophaga hutchinsonii (strain ATCC 33406 / DSM 1761 / CIP 103989 / NBRC 15051 / NCIMB 9469 / D465) TaxID=269798 RepID=A0A6N4SML6_CYTH3|nr:hypothetical protein [Cytophaga hutchinsonii]ABG57504.1 hypothetical protein CHU_0212 [Cytophaga hutchinsonii ATCC 33406]SFW98769.1 hypothetical protein SAMN04487930_10164 [Cytophaga hutchinsonii ATCC 33406]
MKKTLLLSLLITLFLSSFTAQMIPTSLKISVRNELGTIESGVSVKLYASKEDYEKSANPVAAGKTDAKGNIFFQDLKQTTFYISAEKGDRNNFGAGEKIENLELNKVNKVTLIISE